MPASRAVAVELSWAIRFELLCQDEAAGSMQSLRWRVPLHVVPAQDCALPHSDSVHAEEALPASRRGSGASSGLEDSAPLLELQRTTELLARALDVHVGEGAHAADSDSDDGEAAAAEVTDTIRTEAAVVRASGTGLAAAAATASMARQLYRAMAMETGADLLLPAEQAQWLSHLPAAGADGIFVPDEDLFAPYGSVARAQTKKC